MAQPPGRGVRVRAVKFTAQWHNTFGIGCGKNNTSYELVKGYAGAQMPVRLRGV